MLGKRIKRDTAFYQYKLLQILLIIIISIMIYVFHELFDSKSQEDNISKPANQIKKEDLKLDHIYKKYFSPDSPKKQ